MGGFPFIIDSYSGIEIATKFADWLAGCGVTHFEVKFPVNEHMTKFLVSDETMKHGPNIETALHLVGSPNDPGRARLLLKVTCDGEDVGVLTLLSGPRMDVRDYQDGKVTLKQLQEKWGMGKKT